MEEYPNNNHLSENTGPTPRPSFLYSSTTSANSLGGFGRTNSNSGTHHHQVPINPFHLQSGGGGSDHHHCFQSDQVPQYPAVKTEASTSQLHTPILHYPLLRGSLHSTTMHPQQHQQGGSQSSTEVEAIKAKIIAHPQYSNLLEAYMDCQKVHPIINLIHFSP